MYNTPDKAKLVQKWENVPGKLSIADIEDRDVKENMATLLENQQHKNFSDGNAFNFMTEASQASNTISTSTLNDPNGGQFRPMTLALVRRTFPVLFANKVVGVQAMSTPVGLAYALRFLYKDYPDNEAAFNDVAKFSGFTGNEPQAAGGAIPGVPNPNAVPGLDTSGITSAIDTGTGAPSVSGEAFQFGGTGTEKMPELSFRVDQTSVVAQTRKMAASFSLESAQDIKAMHGVDIEREMLSVLQYEIMAELDRELLQRMKVAAVTISYGGEAVTNIDVTASNPLDGRWSQERYAGIVTSIIKKANDIAISTRRGAGNFVIVSGRVATALQAAGPQFSRNTALVDNTTTLAEVGTINGTIKVYRDSYAINDYALIGYKGPGISDSGIIFSPYITGVTNRTVAQDDFSPRLGVMSRYGVTDTLLGSGRYYRLINYQNLATIVPG
jgi:hypothetical protein